MSTQQIAAVKIGSDFHTVLVRPTRWGVSLKLASKPLYLAYGLLEDESAHLEQHPDKAQALLRGEVVKL
jgi:hypothetical protein